MKKSLFFLLLFGLFFIQESISQILYLDSENASYIHASAFSPANEVILFFSGSAVMLYDINVSEVTEVQWFKLEDVGDIDAAVTWTDDQVLVFEKNSYRVFEVSTASFVSEKQIWFGLPEEWSNSVDAIVRWSVDEIMFFRGNEFLLYSFAEEAYTAQGTCDEWEGWEEQWKDGIDAAFTLNGEIYFLNDGGALQYSVESGSFYETIPIGFDLSENNE